jgi:hypothetical protein
MQNAQAADILTYTKLEVKKVWSLILQKEYRLRLSENRGLRRVFGPKREEVVGGWRIVHTEELCNLYSSPNLIRVIKSRRIRWAGYIDRYMQEMRNVYNIFVGKPVRKSPLRRPRCISQDNAGMDLKKLGWKDVKWIHLAQNRNQW